MAFRSSSVTDGTGPSSLDPGKPSGTLSTDVLVMSVCCGNFTSADTITAPTGWTLINRIDNSNNTIATYWALGSVASTSFSFSGNVAGINVICDAFSGRKTSSPISGTPATGSGSGSTNIAPTMTAQSGDDLLRVWASNQATTQGNAPSSTVDINQAPIANGAAETAYKNSVSAGLVGTEAVTATNFVNKTSQTICLAAAAASGGLPFFMQDDRLSGGIEQMAGL